MEERERCYIKAIKIKNLAMLRKIYGTNFFHIKFGAVVASNVKMDQCCPQFRFFYFNGQALKGKTCKRKAKSDKPFFYDGPPFR
jgi:hypothetical protein